MNTKYLRRARQLFNSEYVPAHVNRHNQRTWARQLRALGTKWLLARSV
jgi:hypothetical protein